WSRRRSSTTWRPRQMQGRPSPSAEGFVPRRERFVMGSSQSLHEFDAAAGVLARRAARFVEERARHQHERIGPPPTAAELGTELAGAITTNGVGLGRAFDLFTDAVMPHSLTPEHPRFLAFVAYAPAVGAVLFDSALSAAGVFGTSWLEGAGAAAAENQALRWL